MKPKPWSFSALSAFVTCPRQYEAKNVSKTVKEEFSGPHLEWGKKVHTLFEERQKYGVMLAGKLEKHEPYMLELSQCEGIHFTERKLAFDKKLQPCGYFDNSVWTRGVLDWSTVAGSYARVVDYKTGKKKDNPKQLALFSIYMFLLYPAVTDVDVEFYWVDLHDDQDRRSTRSYKRSDLPALWRMFTPDLSQYVEAYKTNTWQPRQSGLCHGWCPVQDCEFWKPKKDKY